MAKTKLHTERHRSDRIGWLRAAVLGANDGILSTASLIVGVAAAPTSREAILLSGAAGLVAGAMSMAAGEYVSVSSQADVEHADLARERKELHEQPDLELDELAGIYEGRGVEPALARQVATQMMKHDALGAHARDELGIFEHLQARPIQAALVSALTFTSGALLPLAGAAFFPRASLLTTIPVLSLLILISLGALAARTGGAAPLKGALRVGFWGAFAMFTTAGIGYAFG